MIVDYSCSTGEKIRLLRISRNLTQEELAANIGISNRTISNYEKGVSVPDRITLEALAAFFKYDIRYFTNDGCLREEYYLEEESYMMDIYEGAADKNGAFECVKSIMVDKRICLGEKTYIWRINVEFAEKYGVPEGTNYLVSTTKAAVHGDKLLVVTGGKTCIVIYEYTESGKYITECNGTRRVPLKKSDIICGRIRGSVRFEQCQ